MQNTIPSPLKLVHWLLVLGWMAVIFCASSDSMSFQHTSRIFGPLLHWLFPSLSEQAVHTVIFAIRKGAHVLEYAILAFLVWRALRNQSESKRTAWCWSDAGWALLFAMAYAASDEFHQRFVPTRQASVGDVLIDTCGAALALFLVWVFLRARD